MLNFLTYIFSFIGWFKKSKNIDPMNTNEVIEFVPIKPNDPDPIDKVVDVEIPEVSPKKNNPWAVESPSEKWADYPNSLKLDLIQKSREICKDAGLNENEARSLLATVWGESGWNPNCINRGNRDGSVDYGLCQYNDGPKVGKKWWIGEGAPFASVDEVLSDPLKNIRVMASGWKKISWRNNWVAYKNGGYKDQLFRV